uniref:Ferric oxidoreductase domain-containing protein n=1 Tax=Kalanchoe fedtschenkoi TaxID=63787 RepID=A0A7N0TRN6_KALFE
MESKAIDDQGGVRAVRDCIKALMIVVVLLGYVLVPTPSFSLPRCSLSPSWAAFTSISARNSATNPYHPSPWREDLLFWGSSGLTSESSIKYHIWLGHITMANFTAHGLCYVIYWIATRELLEMLSWETRGVANVPGELASIAGLILWACTLPRIRRRMFELFFYSHYLYMFFFILHVGIGYATIMLPGFYLFLVDRYIRFLQSRGCVRLASCARVLPCDTIELNYAKKKNPGCSAIGSQSAQVATWRQRG